MILPFYSVLIKRIKRYRSTIIDFRIKYSSITNNDKFKFYTRTSLSYPRKSYTSVGLGKLFKQENSVSGIK